MPIIYSFEPRLIPTDGGIVVVTGINFGRFDEVDVMFDNIDGNDLSLGIIVDGNDTTLIIGTIFFILANYAQLMTFSECRNTTLCWC